MAMAMKRMMKEVKRLRLFSGFKGAKSAFKQSICVCLGMPLWRGIGQLQVNSSIVLEILWKN